MTTRRTRLAGILALSVLAACTEGGARRNLPEPPGVDRSPLLTRVASCGELEAAIEDAVVAAMRSQLEQARRGWGFWPVGAPAAPVAAGPSDFTTTNSQVAGVDEADFVQNDGTRIAVLTGDALHLLRSWPADALSEAASLPIEGWARELFLAGGEAAVFSSVFQPRPLFDGGVAPCPLLVAGPVPLWCGYAFNNATKVTLVDVSTLEAPAVEAEIFLPGSYLSARRIGDRVRLVLTDSLPFPDGVLFWPADLDPGATQRERDAAFDALAARNEAIIRSAGLGDWLRRGSVQRPDGSAVELGYACQDFAVSSGPGRPGILTVATFDLASRTLVSQTSVLAQANVVYASLDTLYAATSHFWWWPMPGQTDATYVHAFDLRSPDAAPYLGSGVVDGLVDDQYQLDEFEGRLRVASTLRARVDDGTPWGSQRISHQIAVLALEGGVLRTVGTTAPFGDDELLFGTRFAGPRGFAITARQIDPLFTFDLSDPAAPVKVGEVEMPGFIAYLHPIDAGNLLGVGREPGPSGQMQVKVQLLDVTDLANPVARPPTLVGEGWSWSEALWDPKAFTWLGARGILAIPFEDHAPDGFVSDLRLFQVDPATGIAPLGSLSMADVYAGSTEWSFYWSPAVRRGILADGFVYAVSDAGVRSAMVAELPAWLATVRFARPSGP